MSQEQTRPQAHRTYKRELVKVEVADEMILFDLDTSADYEALAARFC